MPIIVRSRVEKKVLASTLSTVRRPLATDPVLLSQARSGAHIPPMSCPKMNLRLFSHLTRSLREPEGFPDHHSLISVECFNNTAHRLNTRYPIQTLILFDLQSLRSGSGNWIRPGTRKCPGSTEFRIFRYFHRGIRAIFEASSSGTVVPFPTSKMTEEFRRLWEALQRHRFTQTASYKGPSWQNRVHIMRRIDEVIHVADENDRYGEPHIFEEADADDRWITHVAQHHERRQAVARPRYQVWKLGAQSAASQPLTAENLALVNASNHPDAGADIGETLSRVQGRTRDAAHHKASSSSPGSSAHSSRATAASSTTRTRLRFPRDSQGSSSDMADRSKGKKMGTEDFFNTNSSSAIESDSSDDGDMEAVADDAEREWILKLFEDFPTVIQKARHLPAIDSDDHGIMTMSNRESGWFHIDPEKLPPRIRQYLAEFTVLEAAAFPDGVYPDLALNGGGSHRWLLATARKEFICDTLTLNVWYRPLNNGNQPSSPRQPL